MSLKISIIVPCFNGENYLEECLNSIVSQDYENIEILFVDNESTDNSLKIAKKFKNSHFDKFKIGSAKNIFKYSWTEPVEEALSRMEGDYFTIIAVDDAISPDYISNVVKVLESLKGEVLCMQSPILRVQSGNINLLTAWRPLHSLIEWKTELLRHCPVNTPTMIYKRELYENNHITYNTEEYLGAADYDLYCQFIDKGITIHNHTEFIGYRYRIHEGQCTWGMVSEARKGNVFDTKIKNYWREKWNL